MACCRKLPQLDADGLLPEGIHRADLREVRRVFVQESDNRILQQQRYDAWLRHREALSRIAPVLGQWLDGSFVTSKPDPGDVDVVTFLDGPEFDALPRWRQDLIVQLLQGHDTRDRWGVDSFAVLVYPSGHPGEAQSVRTEEYWSWMWSRSRTHPHRRKGYVEVVL